jgi:aryl-alcohol dehydrogenase-like predicted oxidoreductase
MDDRRTGVTRREVLKTVAGAAVLVAIRPADLLAAGDALILRAIPGTAERLPVVGMGSSRTFDVGQDPEVRAGLSSVLKLFFDLGGKVIDTSPMYGSAEEVLGDLLAGIPGKASMFAATKVWIDGREAGVRQMQESMRRMKVERFDLIQIHNLRDWREHLVTLREWKDAGKVRYIGITTSHGRAHEELEQVMKSEPLDFVQFSYSIAARAAEQRLLPLAADRGMATLINRPFERGALFERVKGKRLPEWAAEFDCASWGQFFLKFVVSHPAVTCTIPATANPRHMTDNMAACHGRLPAAAQREKMIRYLESL